MNKKKYNAPNLNIVSINTQHFIAASINTVGTDGTDITGEEQFGSRRHNNSLWDDEEDDF